MGQKPSGKREGKEKFFSNVQRAVCLSLVLFGAFLCLEGYLASGISPAALAAAAFLCAALEGLMRMGWKQRAAALLLASLCMEAAVFKYGDFLLEGAKGLANQAVTLVNGHYRTEFLYWLVPDPVPGKEEAFLCLCAILGVLGGFLASFAKRKRGRNAAFLSVPALAAAAGFLMGKAPGLEGLLMILAGFLAVQLEPGARGMLPLGAGMGVALMLAVLFAENGRVWQAVEAYHGPWIKRQLEFEDWMLDRLEGFNGVRLFSWAKPQREYRLDNRNPSQTGKEVFQITVDRQPRQPVYIRGFIGGDYVNGKWDGASRQEFSDWAQGQGWATQACQEAVQNYPYQALEKMEGKAEKNSSSHVKLSCKDAIPGYTLVPYYTQIPEGQPVEGDGALPPANGKIFQWESFLALEGIQGEGFLSLEDWEARPSKEVPREAEGEEEAVWQSYCSYARQAYTRLPEQGLEKAFVFAEMSIYRASMKIENRWMEDLAVQGGFSETWLRSEQIRNFLWKNTTYSQELAPLPEGEDYTAYFLLEQKKGFCVHYATAGTLLLRRYGVPARYVSGYVVFPGDFRQNRDGTFTASVTDMRGHAWAEVFSEKTGFGPLELTPPSYFETLQEHAEGKALDKALGELEGAEEEEGGKPEPKPQESQQEEIRQEQEAQKKGQAGDVTPGVGNQEDKGGEAPGPGIWGIAGICLGAVCCAFLLPYIRGRRLRARRQAAFFQESREEGMLAMGSHIRFLLKSLGFRQQEGMGEREYGEFLSRELPGMEWARAISLMQKAAFSRQGVTEEELQAVYLLCQELEQKALGQRGRLWGWVFGVGHIGGSDG